MEAKEFRELTSEELKEELFELRRKKAVGQLEHGEQVRLVRKDLAKAETVKRQKALGIAK